MSTTIIVRQESKEALEANINKDRFSKKTLEVHCYRNVIIDPLGEGKALVFDYEEKYHSFDIISKEKNVAIYLGYFVTSWGHVLTDGFKKLWFMRTDLCKEFLKEGAKLVFVTTGARDILSANKRMIELLGYSPDQMVNIKQPTLFDTVYCPDDCFWGSIEDAHYTKEYTEQIGFIRKCFCKSENFTTGKIYFTRTRLKDKRDYGEKPVEEFFKKMGYKIIAPETLTADEQIGLVANCSSFAASEGSVAHISIFCKPKTEVIVLRKADYINCYQLAVNQAADINCIYIDAHASYNVSKIWPWAGPFYMCLTSYLEIYFKKRILYLPYWIKPSWYWYMNKNRKLVKKIITFFQNEKR